MAQNFFLERFGLYLTKSKNGFAIVFSNLAQKGSGFFFKARKFFFCQMAYIYLPNSCGRPKCLDFVITTYSYPLIKGKGAVFNRLWYSFKKEINLFFFGRGGISSPKFISV